MMSDSQGNKRTFPIYNWQLRTNKFTTVISLIVRELDILVESIYSRERMHSQLFLPEQLEKEKSLQLK